MADSNEQKVQCPKCGNPVAILNGRYACHNSDIRQPMSLCDMSAERVESQPA